MNMGLIPAEASGYSRIESPRHAFRREVVVLPTFPFPLRMRSHECHASQ